MDALDYLCTPMALGQRSAACPIGWETNTAARQGFVVSVTSRPCNLLARHDVPLACPQLRTCQRNADCSVGGVGMNLQNAARTEIQSEQGNASTTSSISTLLPPWDRRPRARYYGASFFAHFAQGTSGLRPVSVAGHTRPASPHGGSRQARTSVVCPDQQSARPSRRASQRRFGFAHEQDDNSSIPLERLGAGAAS